MRFDDYRADRRPSARTVWLAVALLSAHATRTVNAEDPANGDTAAPKHWAFQPVSDPAPPDAAGDGQPGDRTRNEVDRFVLARLADAQLALSAEADRRALIRRPSRRSGTAPVPVSIGVVQTLAPAPS